MSLGKLSALAFYSKGYLSKVENGEKPLTLELARSCDQALGTGGTLERLVPVPGPDSGEAGRPVSGRHTEAVCPYRGLSAFGRDDSPWFFGREADTAALLAQLTERLQEPGPLMVLAPSGAGKSSLLRAGLLPALARGVLPAAGSQDWPVALLTPGEHPLKELLAEVTRATAAPVPLGKSMRAGAGAFAAAVGHATNGALVTVVDQFEETFTLCRDEAERIAFIEALLALAAPRPEDHAATPTALVVLGARADFYDRCLAYPGLAASLQRGQVALGPLSEAQLREVITRPARRAGLEIEAGLVEVLLRDIGLTPHDSSRTAIPSVGALPLLSHALLGTWQHREKGTLTVAGYRLTGAVWGAVATTAERAYASLSAQQQPAARRILLQLVHIGAEKETGHRTPTAHLLGGDSGSPAPQDALEVFTRARLLIQDTSHVELAHEALIHAWPRLRRWIDEDRARLRDHQLLTETAATWGRENRDAGLLYRGARLAAAHERAAEPGESRPHLTEVAREFLEASTEAEGVERRREQHRIRRLRQMTGSLVALLVLALVVGGVALQQNQEARTQHRVAISRELAARADKLLADRTEAAMLVAASAYRRSASAEARSSLLSAYGQYRSREFTGHAKHVNAVAFSPDGRTLATVSALNDVKLWNTSNRGLVATLSGHGTTVAGVAFSPDGRTLATVSYDRSVKLWDVAAHRLIATLLGHRREVVAVAFSPDGRTLATAGFDRTVRLWDIARQRQASVLSGHTGSVHALAFSPDGRTLASVSSDHTARLWDIATRRNRTTLTGHKDIVMGAAFSPDGRTLATTSADRTARLWDVTTRKQTAVLTGHTDLVAGARFSPDGLTLATVGYDRTARLWDVTTRRTVAVLTAAKGNDVVTMAAFSPDGRTLVTANTGTDYAIFWDASSHRQIATLSGQRTPGTVVSFSPDGRWLAGGDDNGTVTLRDSRTPQSTSSFTTGTSPVNGLAFTPDGNTLAVANGSKDISVRETASGRQTATFHGDTGAVNELAYSPDGHTLATADNYTTRLWSTATHRQTAVLTGHKRPVTKLAFSPDGRVLVTASVDGTVKLWNTGSGQAIATLDDLADSIIAIALSPDGRTLAAAGRDRMVHLWDIRTHRRTAQLHGHTRSIDGAAFSPDGRTLVTTSEDHTVRLWDPASGKAKAVLSAPGASRSPGFSPDGRTLAAASDDTMVRLWDLDADKVAEQICDLSTQHRWAEVLPGLPPGSPC